MNPDKTNENGLTFRQWLNAAFLGKDGVAIYNAQSQANKMLLEDYWEGGIDPAEIAKGHIF